MKLFLLIISFFFSFLSFSQDEPQSLLWEISGNGIEKPSYIYGTMHVSKKVAFRLDDVFFEALEKSESIALESDPSTWLEHNYEAAIVRPQNFSDSYQKNFYSSLFELEHPEEVLIRSAIRSDNRMINGYLYRKDTNADNFEEETYLDMFIYQAGKKKNKPIVSLEDLDESQFLTSKARQNAYKKKMDSWLVELYEKENPYLLQEDTYRERNLALLDSIGEASNTTYFRENMLYKRNDNMITVLDSLIKKQTVFAGVGAAHLPGEKGMLNLLRQKGYTVKPLVSNQTEKGQEAKQNLEDYIATPVLKPFSTTDGFITLNTFTKLREFYYNGQKYSVAPDMTNGAYLTISRFNIFDYLPNDKPIDLDRLENFLFEDIPGDIIVKEKITSPFPGLSILNKTKKGDYQKYHIYKTPLEVIIIKFGGPKNYVLDYENAIFSSVTFKKPSSEFETFVSPYSKYEVQFPKFKVADNLPNPGNKLIQGSIGNDYYFLKESVNQDTYYIEEDAFEAKFIIENFFKDLELKDFSGTFADGNYKSYEAIAKTDSLSSTKVYLKSIVKDGSYYLLGYSGDTETKAKDFFNSFKFKTINYDAFEETIDTSLHFSVVTNTKPILNNYNSYSDKKQKDYDYQLKQTTYFSKANEQISISRTKFHDLQMYTNVDSLWNEIDEIRKHRKIVDDYRDYIVTNKQKSKKDNIYYYTYTLKDSLSAKTVLVKTILKKGVLFEIKALTDSISKPSSFISNFYDTFKPLDTLLGENIFTDKTERFFAALKDNDSIVLNSYDIVKYNKQHTNQIIDILKYFDFSENKKNIKEHLIEELSKIEDPKVMPFLKDLYTESYSNPEIQITILKALLNKKTKVAYSDFLSLLNKDLPLQEYKVKSLFHSYKDSLELKRNLFPELLEFSTIQEYKEPIYKLLSTLKDNGLIKVKAYKKYKKLIINDGKTEIKRSLSTSKGYNSKHSELYNYVNLIFPFRKEQISQNFFERLLDSDDAEALTTYYTMLEKANEPIPKKLKEKTLGNYKNQALLIDKLYAVDLKKDYLKQYVNQEKYAKSYLFSDTDLEKERDSISFLTKETFKTDNDKEGEIYFYILHRKSDYGNSKKLYYAAFLRPEKNDFLVTETYFESGYNGDYISENDKEGDLIEDILELVVHKNRKRLNKRY